MKNLSLFFSLVLFAASCNSISQEDIVGVWKVKTSNFESKGLTKFDIDDLKEKENLKTYYFKPDGSLLIDYNDGKGPRGEDSWEYLPDNNMIIIRNDEFIYPEMTELRFRISKLDDSALHIFGRSETNPSDFIEIHMVKQQ